MTDKQKNTWRDREDRVRERESKREREREGESGRVVDFNWA